MSTVPSPKMTIAVLGASGAAGRQVVSTALRRGHAVIAFVRRPGVFAPAARLTESIWADVTDKTALAVGLAGANAVVSALGSRQGGPTTVCTDGSRAAVSAMAAVHVTRLIALSAFGVHETHNRSLYSMAVWAKVGEKMKDMESMESVIAESSLDWTIVRPPRLTHSPGTGTYQVGDGLPISLWHSIGRQDLAAFLVREIEEPHFTHRYPRICQ